MDIFLLLTGVLMLARMPYIFNDQPITRGQTLYLVTLQVLVLPLFHFTTMWLIFSFLVLLYNGLVIYTETLWKTKRKTRLVGRWIALVLPLLLYSIFTVHGSWLVLRKDGVQVWVEIFQQHILVFSLSALRRLRVELPVMIVGLLFLMNETNLIVRLVFQVFGFSPLQTPAASHPITRSGFTTARVTAPAMKDEYQAGRLIGILERIFVYYAVLQGVYAIIGFITAAKAFARFKELEKRAFAEYVLIGTLISVLMALITAWLSLPGTP